MKAPVVTLTQTGRRGERVTVSRRRVKPGTPMFGVTIEANTPALLLRMVQQTLTALRKAQPDLNKLHAMEILRQADARPVRRRGGR